MRFLSPARSLLRAHSPTPPAVQFQILSDLHLEIGQQYNEYDFPATAPYLVLAGDIGCLIDYEPYLTFLERQTSRFEAVLWVLGNHEFYDSTHDAGIALAEKMVREPRVSAKLVLLHRRVFDVPGTDVVVLGCTLWSHIPDDAQLMVRMKVQDFSIINGWTVEQHNAEHRKDVAWLREMVSNIRTGPISKEGSISKEGRNQTPKVLIVTHHAPCVKGTSEPRFDDSPWGSAFSTDLLNNKAEWAGVVAWAYGHTHYSTQFKKSGIRIVSNQRGYVLPNEQKKEPDRHGKGRSKIFDATFVVNI